MKKEELIRAFADKMDITYVDANEITNTFFNVIADALAAGESVPLSGIGKFSIDIRTGRVITLQFAADAGKKRRIPDKKYVKFTQSKSMKDRLAGEVNDAS